MQLQRDPVLAHGYLPIDMFSLLLSPRFSNATNPRDKIYALLAIANDGREFEVDYAKPV